jgi:aryl-alcohol dehydrogenase-like predicted oxidoreductase
MGDDTLNRRELLGGLAAGTLLASVPAEAAAGDIPYRTLGRTGARVSIIGVGGSHIGNPDEATGIRIIRTALDNGINFLDNSWDYHDGDSEMRMGKALGDGYRQKAFLMTKFDGRTKETAAKQIDESLKRLRTDHLDLLQFHENIRYEDPDRFFAPGGAVEALTDARQAGKTRFIGFTGHKDPHIHLYMLQKARERGFQFDTIQFPINVMDGNGFRSFEKLLLPEAARMGIAVLTMKPLAGGFVMKSNTVSAIEALHYAMSRPGVVVTINGMDSMDRLNQGLEAARTFRPLTGRQAEAILAKARPMAETGHFELYKTTAHFDSTAKHPEYLGGASEPPA